ncbi:hypothetical protein J3R82DRAFT_4346 [Butyriboletus roseoflavus]|nr:hypothetical protein J3R82DRAFT_4346 [Butyriboletus roseoflavus]
METPRRMPLQDLSLDQFLTPTASKGATKSQTYIVSRRVLDAAGTRLSNNVAKSSPSHPVPFMHSNMHTVTPTRPSRLAKGQFKYHVRLVRNYRSSQGTLSPSNRCSPSRELYPKPTIESSTDPQSRHYPGFAIFRDSEHRRDTMVLRVPSDDGAQIDRPEGDKENVPLRRRAKKLSSKKRLSSGLDGSDASCLSTPVQTSKAVHPQRTPFSARQALR